MILRRNEFLQPSRKIIMYESLLCPLCEAVKVNDEEHLFIFLLLDITHGDSFEMEWNGRISMICSGGSACGLEFVVVFHIIKKYMLSPASSGGGAITIYS
jgi:hypothetical protein